MTRAFGGGGLLGDRLVRLIYLDEAGTSAKEPHSVVVGAIVDADAQLDRIERRFSEITETCVPECEREGLIFHAKDLYHGTKKFNRDKWPREKRHQILADILAIPREFTVPLAIGYAKREHYVADHWIAFVMCALACEQYMRGRAQNEVALLVSENNDQMRAMLKDADKLLRHPNEWKKFVPEEHQNLLPLAKIKDTVHFVLKHESIALQLADACAFAIARHAAGSNYSDQHFRALFPNLAVERFRQDAGFVVVDFPVASITRLLSRGGQ
ncbi:MAG: hypothetical protein BroJett024_34050 [Alphaproteobacteria bacterium]|nr:MAG: hypothetical protein BroJett024_34050 [Alphaproteobacteria bacterium]